MNTRFLAAALGAACCAGAWAAPPAHADVAFVSIRDGDPHIYLKEGNKAERQLTHGRTSNVEPAWSPDGSRLAFTSAREGLIKIFVMNADGSAQNRLTTDDRLESAPSWSPDGTALAFYSLGREAGSSEMRIVDLRSGRTTSIAGNGRDKGPAAPSWSDDGSRLAFTGLDAKGKVQVWVVERDGSGLREISHGFSPRDKAFAALSPDGTRVAYIADMRGGADLIVTEIATLESKNLSATGTATKHENPQWSADGRRLLFGSTRDDADLVRMDIFVMNADGTGMRNLTRHPHEDYDARWSTDGLGVLFTSLRTGTAQLHRVDLDGRRTERVSNNASHDMGHAPRPSSERPSGRVSLNRTEKP